MKPLRKFSKDRVSSVVLIVLGVAIVVEAISYRMGTLTRMGAGFVPAVLGTLLALAGLAIGITADKGDFGDAKSAPTEWRGWLCILGGVFAFVLVGTYGGLVPATFVSVFIAAMGDKGNSIRDALMLAVALVIAGTAIFSYGLKLQLPLFQWG